MALNRLTGQFVALKSIAKQFMADEASLRKIEQEFKILKGARH